MSESSISEEEWTDLDEDGDTIVITTKCLFCDYVFDRPEKALDHCQETHQFDIHMIQAKYNLDCFSFIKMVNYIRKQKISAKFVANTSSAVPWSSDEYLQPVIQDDGMLQFDIEDSNKKCATNIESNKEAGCDGEAEICSTEQRLKLAEQRAQEAELALQRVMKDLHKSREVARQLIMSTTAEPQPMVPCFPIGAGASMSDDEDEDYFSGYGHFGIHLEMLQDKARTDSYRDAILGNPDLFKDKIVLDVGCGTGILSMFAAQAGASQVIAIDQSDVVYQAMDIVRENGLENKITLIKGKVEFAELPVEKVDIIISEWMGYFLLFESMLDTVLFARDKWLNKTNGVVLPNKCRINLVAIDDGNLYQSNIGYWDNVYGFKMSCMKKEVVKEASTHNIVNEDSIISEPVLLKEIDTEKCTVKELDFYSEFVLKIVRDGSITALVGYFDVQFSSGCTNQVILATSPFDTATHWKQTIFHLDKPIQVTSGEELKCSASVKKNRKDPRSLIVTLTVNGKSRTYNMH